MQMHAYLRTGHDVQGEASWQLLSMLWPVLPNSAQSKLSWGPCLFRNPSEKNKNIGSELYDYGEHSVCRLFRQSIEESPSGIMLVNTEIMLRA